MYLSRKTFLVLKHIETNVPVYKISRHLKMQFLMIQRRISYSHNHNPTSIKSVQSNKYPLSKQYIIYNIPFFSSMVN